MLPSLICLTIEFKWISTLCNLKKSLKYDELARQTPLTAIKSFLDSIIIGFLPLLNKSNAISHPLNPPPIITTFLPTCLLLFR